MNQAIQAPQELKDVITEFSQGNYHDALAILESVISVHPTSPIATQYRALCKTHIIMSDLTLPHPENLERMRDIISDLENAARLFRGTLRYAEND